MGITEKPLITVLTPCYNSEKYIHRLLDSVLNQDYPRIQMIVMDDGSTDSSAEIIKSFIPKFNAKGYILEYYFQSNQGQSVAINNGLKKVRGSYLLWPDSDDYYADKDTVGLLVGTLERLPNDYAMARTWINYIDENSLSKTGVGGPGLDEAEFENCLFARDFYFQPGCVIVDFKKLCDVTSLDIYTDKNAGQNWQLYLPILSKYKCKTIPKAKFNVLCRADSHSRGQYKTLKELNSRIDSYENTLLSTLDRIQNLEESQRESYKKTLKQKYAFERFYNALAANDREETIKTRNAIKKLDLKIGKKDKIKYYLVLSHLLGVKRKLFTLMKVRK